MKSKKRVAAAVWMAALLVLESGCGAGTDANETAERIRQTYEALDGYTAQVKILSDLGQSTMEYGGRFEYNREGNDIFTLETPESLAGITITASGERADDLTIAFEDTAFDLGGSVRPGLTAADALPLLMDSIRSSAPLETWEETVGGVRMAAARYETEDDQGRIMRQVWFTSDSLRPSYAELYADGQRVMQVFFSQFQE